MKKKNKKASPVGGMVDTPALEAGVERRTSSSLVLGTITEVCVSGLNDSLAKGTDPLKGSEGSNPSTSAIDIMKYANDYEAGY